MLNPDDRLFFIHIPKTAGTTLIPLIDMHFHEREICPAQLWRELVHLPQESLPSYRLFRGHFGGGGLTSFLPQPPVCMTMLRQPLPLTVSTYKFIKREPGTRVHDLVAGGNMSLDDFLECRKTANKAADKQVRHLSFDLRHDPESGPIFHHRESLAAIDRWVADHRARIAPNERLERAIARLESCAFFGLVERFEESMALMCHTFGWPPVGPVQKLMVAPEKQSGDGLTDQQIEKIRSLNALDEQLYAWAERVFNERLAAMRGDLARFAPGGRVSPDADLRPLLDARYASARAARDERPRERVRIDFDEPLWGDGWHRREASAHDGTAFRWTGPATESTVDVAVDRSADLRVTLCLINAIAPDVEQAVRLFADEHEVDLHAIAAPSHGRVVQGLIPARPPGRPPRFTRLRLTCPRVASPHSIDRANPDTRDMGVAVNWIDLAPAASMAEGATPEIQIDPRRIEELRRRKRSAAVARLKQRVAAIPVVGPRLRTAYARWKNR
jgi:hypothetical protein